MEKDHFILLGEVISTAKRNQDLLISMDRKMSEYMKAGDEFRKDVNERLISLEQTRKVATRVLAGSWAVFLVFLGVLFENRF